jgi:hypothetical protein
MPTRQMSPAAETVRTPPAIRLEFRLGLHGYSHWPSSTRYPAFTATANSIFKIFLKAICRKDLE